MAAHPIRKTRIPDDTWARVAAHVGAEPPVPGGQPTPAAMMRAALEEYADLRDRGEHPTWWPRVRGGRQPIDGRPDDKE